MRYELTDDEWTAIKPDAAEQAALVAKRGGWAPSGPAPTVPMRLFSSPQLGQALGARLLLVG